MSRKDHPDLTNLCWISHVPWRHQFLWSTHIGRECLVLFTQQIIFLIGIIKTISFAWHGKLLQVTYSLASVTGSCPLLLFKKTNKSLNPPKCTCYMHRCVPSDGNVAASRVRIYWLACPDCNLNGCWWEYDEQILSWTNTIGVIDSNQHDLPACRCNVMRAFHLKWPCHPYQIFPLTDLKHGPPT